MNNLGKPKFKEPRTIKEIYLSLKLKVKVIMSRFILTPEEIRKRNIMELWVEALTSGNYKHRTKTLRKDDYFCATGVLCDIHRKYSGQPGYWDLDGAYFVHDKAGVNIPPRQVIDWAGIKNLIHLEKVIMINDTSTSFIPAAKYIQDNWREL